MEKKGFSTTQWSIVLAAGKDEGTQARAALETLCRTYWPPVHAYIRSRGHDAESAKDLTQSFFTALLARRGLEQARQERGRFRSFLLASVANFLSDERDHAHAAKRGGGQPLFSLDPDPSSSAFAFDEPATTETPERVFERRWVAALLERALLGLEEEMSRAGGGERFAKLREFLVGDADAPYARLAQELGTSEGAARVALHRMRQRFADTLRRQVAETLDDPGDVEDELRHLIQLVGS